MRLGILDTEKRTSEQFFACQTSTHLLETIEVVEKSDLKNLDALLICKNQVFGMREVCEWVIKMKAHKDVPIWISSSESHLEEKNVYLQLGVCGVFERNYSVEEINLSIINSLTMMRMDAQESAKENDFFMLDPLKLSLFIGKSTIPLTKLEFVLLELLYDHKEEVCTYEMLAQSLLGEQFEFLGETGQSRVANIVCKIRSKLSQRNEGKQELIRTVRSRGYMLTLTV